MEDREMNYTAAQHERELTRIEIQAKRWFIAFLIVLCMLFITNAGWVAERFFCSPAVTTGAVSYGHDRGEPLQGRR